MELYNKIFQIAPVPLRAKNGFSVVSSFNNVLWIEQNIRISSYKKNCHKFCHVL